jgi:nitrate/TMAO reductase-like tetraheme cytochrome c subunit
MSERPLTRHCGPRHRSRALAERTHCVHGHPFEGDNLKIEVTPRGVYRRCRACHVAVARRAYLRRKANAAAEYRARIFAKLDAAA